MRRLCDRDIPVSPVLPEPAQNPHARWARAPVRIGLVRGGALLDGRGGIDIARAQAGLEQDHVRDRAQRLERQLRRRQVVEGPVAEGDIELSERADPIWLLEVERRNLSRRMTPLDLRQQIRTRVGREHLAAALFEESGEESDARPNFEDRLALDWKVKAREMKIGRA